jgi:hypothetical protein
MVVFSATTAGVSVPLLAGLLQVLLVLIQFSFYKNFRFEIAAYPTAPPKLVRNVLFFISSALI